MVGICENWPYPCIYHLFLYMGDGFMECISGAVAGKLTLSLWNGCRVQCCLCWIIQTGAEAYLYIHPTNHMMSGGTKLTPGKYSINLVMRTDLIRAMCSLCTVYCRTWVVCVVWCICCKSDLVSVKLLQCTMLSYIHILVGGFAKCCRLVQGYICDILSSLFKVYIHYCNHCMFPDSYTLTYRPQFIGCG